jgi:NSS family neurotransmitter:Na+ symporter
MTALASTAAVNGEAANDSDARWSSSYGFLVAQLAAAIGLGSLWRFPYVAGANGGGAFVLLYILFVAMLCVPIMLAEMAIGRVGGGSAVRSVALVIERERLRPGWSAIGWISLFIPFIGLSYYSVVASWCLEYTWQAVVTGFDGLDGPAASKMFSSLTGDALRQVVLQFAFIGASVWVVSRGIQQGIERISRIKIAALAITLVIILAFNATTFGLGPTAAFLFKPDFSSITRQGVLTAFGQAVFSTGIGGGVMMTFSAYMPRGMSLQKASVLVAGPVVLVALMAGFAIFPAVLSFGLAPGEGPGLVFVTLPTAFNKMPGGHFIAILFFSLFSISAFTCAVGLLEPTVRWLMERSGAKRGPVAMAVGLMTWLIGLPSILSFNLLRDFHPFGTMAVLGNKTVFALIDALIGNVLLPVNAALISAFMGWAVSRHFAGEVTGLKGAMLWAWRFVVGIVAPAGILFLMLSILV